jgi:hypothetical protein
MDKTKSYVISRHTVWEAYKLVKAVEIPKKNGGARILGIGI